MTDFDDDDGSENDSDTEDSVGGVLYDLAGTGGKAESTIAGKNSAMRRFDQFLATKNMETWDKLTQKQLCKKTLFQEFGTYLSKFAYHSKKDDVLIGWLSCKQFFSGVKNVIHKKYKANRIWKDKQWIKDIRLDIDKIVCNRCIALGVPMMNKSEPIGRLLMLVMVRALLKGARTHTEQRSSVEYWAALVMTFAACGRGGECAQSRWGVTTWNSVYMSVQTLWNELKTSRQKVMLFFPDFQHYELCFYHSFGCYLILGAGSTHVTSHNADSGLLFPFLHGDTKGKDATSKLSSCMKKQQEATGGALPTEVSVKCLRVGAVQEIVNRTKDIACGIARGGWGDYLASVTAMMEYHCSSYHTLATGGRALAGWPDPEHHVVPPTCDAFLDHFSPEDTAKFNLFLDRLFASAHGFSVVKNVALRPLALCCFASLVQHLKQFVSDYGTDHLVIKTLYHATKTYGFRVRDLVAWGDAVTSRWSSDNAKALAGDKDLALEVAELRAVQTQQTLLLERQSQQMAEQARLMALQHQQLAEQNALMHSIALFIGSKRDREGEPIVQPCVQPIVQPCVQPIVQPCVQPIVQPCVQPIVQPCVQPIVQPCVQPTVLPPPVLVPARNENAFDIMMKTPPTPMETIPCTLSLYDFLILWYERGFQFHSHGTTWKAKIRQDKNRIGKILKEISVIAAASCAEAALNAHNFDKLSAACSSIVCVVHDKYTLTGTTFTKPPTLAAIASKIGRSIETQPVK